MRRTHTFVGEPIRGLGTIYSHLRNVCLVALTRLELTILGECMGEN